MIGVPGNLRRRMATSSLVLALMFIAWLPLGLFEVVPFILELPGESLLRTHAGAAVFFLLVAAWGFWPTDD